ncbi:lipopolysaccharide biosynthesis protein [Candidatus Latescibacterota bacterium]
MVGIFAVCFRIFQLFQRGSDVTGTVLYSNVAQNEEKSGYYLTMNVCRNLLFFSAIFAVIGGLLGKNVILIVSDSKFLDAYYPLLIMFPGIVLMNTGTVLNSSYWGRGYPFKVIIAPYIAAGFGLIMDIVLIPIYGTSGATMSFSLMSVIWFIYIAIIFKRDSGFRFNEILIPRYSDFVKLYSKLKMKLIRSET